MDFKCYFNELPRTDYIYMIYLSFTRYLQVIIVLTSYFCFKQKSLLFSLENTPVIHVDQL